MICIFKLCDNFVRIVIYHCYIWSLRVIFCSEFVDTVGGGTMLLLPANFPEPYPALKRLLKKVASPPPSSSSTAASAAATGGALRFALPLTIRFVVERTVLEPTSVDAQPWQSVTQRSPLQTRIVWMGPVPPAIGTAAPAPRSKKASSTALTAAASASASDAPSVSADGSVSDSALQQPSSAIVSLCADSASTELVHSLADRGAFVLKADASWLQKIAEVGDCCFALVQNQSHSQNQTQNQNQNQQFVSSSSTSSSSLSQTSAHHSIRTLALESARYSAVFAEGAALLGWDACDADSAHIESQSTNINAIVTNVESKSTVTMMTADFCRVVPAALPAQRKFAFSMWVYLPSASLGPHSSGLCVRMRFPITSFYYSGHSW
jgi:hypothetical protein